MDRLEALVDEYRPFAIEAQRTETDRQSEFVAIRVHFSSRSDRDAAGSAIKQLGHAAVLVERADVDDDGQYWSERSQASLRAVRVGRLVIAPPWDIPGDAPDTSVVVITPSMGFGTGHHQTTRLCLRALQDQPVDGAAVVDLGTGSGILAISAAKLGAASVVAVESDRDALRCAHANVAANHVTSTVRIAASDIRQVSASRRGDVIMANLTGDLLVSIAGTIASYANDGARLIVSGFAATETRHVERAFASFARVQHDLCEDEWACLTMRVD